MFSNQVKIGLLLGALFVGVLQSVVAASPSNKTPNAPPQAAVATAHPLATQAGLEALSQGGNAFDAAVAVSATLAVVEPYSSGLGGGGFWLLHRAADGFEVMIDGRERAPLKAHRDMYLDTQGEIIEGASMNGALAAGIPGEPAALDHLAKQYGRLPLHTSLAPAITLAEQGFEVDRIYLRLAGFRKEALNQSTAAEIFLRDGNLPQLGDIIKQPDLANTLRAMAKKGRAGFYSGEVATKLISGVQAAGGIWSEKDLRDYQIIERQPITGEFKGMRVTSAALPSSGGIVLMEMLNQLEGFNLKSLDEAGFDHLLTEVMRRAYRDRAEYMGDPDTIDVPAAKLLSKPYATQLRETIQMDRATPSSELPATAVTPSPGDNTTHFSIIDREGNAVSATLSINYPFGSCFVPEGTGVLLNDEMDDFAAKPGVPNAYGLVGNEANSIAPGKRMLSSMTPTFLNDGNRIAALGSPGGSRIITMVLFGALAFSEGASAAEMVGLPRFHHQYLPDEITFEPGALSTNIQNALKQKGHQLKPQERDYGNMQAIVWDHKNNTIEAASDPRGIGLAVPAAN
jgi:gamma-glutamyltranspeptidase/glutathione hydrolase